MTTRLRTVVTALLLLGVGCSAAHAQLARTFVSSFGNDANDCGRATPCRTFQTAHDKTLANGEITVLDPGGYGAVIITKTISIINDGVGEAGALVSGGLNGITVAAGASDSVSLRGLTIKGIGFGGGNGIVFNSGKALTIENCVVRNLTTSSTGGAIGISFRSGTASSLAISNTLVADNAVAGINISPQDLAAGATVKAVLYGAEVYGNGVFGVVVSGQTSFAGTINATLADSVVAHTEGQGIIVSSDLGARPATSLMVIRTVASNNVIGMRAVGGNATLRVGQSTLTGNTTSWQNTGGTLRSYGDNNIDGNGDGDPAIPSVIAKK